MLKSFIKQTLPASIKCFVIPVRTAVYSADTINPIVQKEAINSIAPDDPRHFMQVKPPLASQSNSMFYNERLEYVLIQ